MKTREPVSLARECESFQIPTGNKILLPAGMKVKMTQALGGTYTVITEDGYMVRIEGKDADALGEKPLESSPKSTAPVSEEELEKMVWAQLKTVFDPEIPVNVVDLGLIYLCRTTPLPGEGFKVEVKMTLTAPGCGMGGVLQADAYTKIMRLPGVKQLNVELVVDPPWNQDMMSEAAKLQLGML